MYSLVLMMALGSGATAPSVDATERPTLASFGNHNHIVNRGRGCHGCHGCYGCSCYGCYGCWCYGCHGCYGCYGCSCYGCSCYGCACFGCHCYGGYGGYGSYVSSGYYGAAVARADAAATIVVTLPSDAKLSVDDYATTSTAGRRTFISPPLQNGQDYYYTLKAVINRDGKAITSMKQVIVQAGKETEVKFEFDTSAVALR